MAACLLPTIPFHGSPPCADILTLYEEWIGVIAWHDPNQDMPDEVQERGAAIETELRQRRATHPLAIICKMRVLQYRSDLFDLDEHQRELQRSVIADLEALAQQMHDARLDRPPKT